jgi:hypothetical protein
MRLAKSEAIARELEKTRESVIVEDDQIDDVSDDEDDNNPAPTTQSNKPHEFVKIQAIPKSSSTRQRRKRRLPQAPDPTVAERATMVDQIMQESFLPRYTKKSINMIRGRAAATTTVDPSANPSDANNNNNNNNNNPSEEPIDADSAVAEAFKAEFLRGLKERNSRRRERQILNATSTRAAPPKEGITPKLGGSRAQRGKMRAAREEAKAASSGGGAVPAVGPAGAGGTGSG